VSEPIVTAETRKPIHPVVAQRLAREAAEKRAAELEAERLAAQLNRTPPPDLNPPPANPANDRRPAPFQRIPMNVPRRKLEVRGIDGYRLYWHKQSDIEAAIDAGYEFVDKGEVRLNSRAIGSASGLGGNTALGSEVSIVGSKGTGERLILMKIRKEWYEEDKRSIFQEHATRMRAIFEGDVIMMPGGDERPDVVVGPDGQLHGSGTTYVKKQPYVALFNRGPRVAPQVAGAKVRTY
jgi:hypothetical protein